MNKKLLSVLFFLLGSFQANAAIITWVDWTSVTGTTVSGTLTNGSEVVNVTLTSSSPFLGVELNGSPWWTGTAYTNGIVDNSPVGLDVVRFNAGGTVTVTFSQMVDTPLLAINSWNRNVVNFNTPITIDSVGKGFWGTGSATSITPTSFSGSGELHGIISVTGQTNSFSFTHNSENWHGLTIGVVNTSTQVSVSEPSMLGLLGIGLLMMRRFKR